MYNMFGAASHGGRMKTLNILTVNTEPSFPGTETSHHGMKHTNVDGRAKVAYMSFNVWN